MKWLNEREVPTELLELLDMPITPKELWKEITRARNEVDNYGAVTYPTKAKAEALYTQFALNQLDKEYKT